MCVHSDAREYGRVGYNVLALPDLKEFKQGSFTQKFVSCCIILSTTPLVLYSTPNHAFCLKMAGGHPGLVNTHLHFFTTMSKVSLPDSTRCLRCTLPSSKLQFSMLCSPHFSITTPAKMQTFNPCSTSQPLELKTFHEGKGSLYP